MYGLGDHFGGLYDDIRALKKAMRELIKAALNTSEQPSVKLALAVERAEVLLKKLDQ